MKRYICEIVVIAAFVAMWLTCLVAWLEEPRVITIQEAETVKDLRSR